ncbi:MAG TPA: hypothetical protein VMU34_06740 [Mycobacterium sp.]|nr:hypothetical protein [Mycobacterium sp.]
MSDRLASAALADIGAYFRGVPLWEVVVVLGGAAAIIAAAVWSHPRRPAADISGSHEALIAVIGEIREVDRVLSAQANGVLTLSTIAAGAFATVVQENGGPGRPWIFATAIALLTSFTVAAIAFALAGGPTGAAVLPTTELRVQAERSLRRAYRRTLCVRTAVWCLFPTVLLVVICIARVRR